MGRGGLSSGHGVEDEGQVLGLRVGGGGLGEARGCGLRLLGSAGPGSCKA